VVDSLISSYLDCYENQNISNRKNLKFFRSSLRNKSTGEAELWNILITKKLNAKTSGDRDLDSQY
jgi:hypothetical protein